MKQSHFYGVYGDFDRKGNRILFTKNLVPGKKVYDEELVREKDEKTGKIEEFRTWNPSKSKLAAGIMKGMQQTGIKPGSFVLYLGAASGTTVSHVSDIVGENGAEGFVFALDFAPRVVRDLYFVAKDRKNIAPILGDAALPDSYQHHCSDVDVVFQDIAQKKQAEIFLLNCKKYLVKGGFGILSVKARSVDVTRSPKGIFNEIRQKLEKEMVIVDYRELAPFELDHALFVVKKK